MRRPRSERAARLVPLVVLVGGLVAWEGGVRSGAVSALFYPPPSAIGGTLVEMLREGALTSNLGATMSRILLGFAFGGGIALVVGLCMGWSTSVRLAVDPIIAAIHPVPRLALLPLILLMFGIGETSRVIVVALSSFFPVLINAAAGVRQIQPIHFDVARSFGASRLQVFTDVVLPGSLPSVLAGARLGLISALKTTLGIELITSEQGLGHLIWFSWETFRTSQLYATLLIVALLGMALNTALRRLTAWAAPGPGAAMP
ncbi:MAG TPA: ABC transporter permease [Thermoanaerobaculia bacterium]|nr:ABC transporter permease [Thermoanaerobaculia bacterium]